MVIATHDIALMDQYDARRLVLHEGRCIFTIDSMTDRRDYDDDGAARISRAPLPQVETPIVPRSSIGGRALVAVVAIMTFLASLTTGGVMLVQSGAEHGRNRSCARSRSRSGRVRRPTSSPK